MWSTITSTQSCSTCRVVAAIALRRDEGRQRIFEDPPFGCGLPPRRPHAPHRLKASARLNALQSKATSRPALHMLVVLNVNTEHVWAPCRAARASHFAHWLCGAAGLRRRPLDRPGDQRLVPGPDRRCAYRWAVTPTAGRVLRRCRHRPVHAGHDRPRHRLRGAALPAGRHAGADHVTYAPGRLRRRSSARAHGHANGARWPSGRTWGRCCRGSVCTT